jgi:hypothetical protein
MRWKKRRTVFWEAKGQFKNEKTKQQNKQTKNHKHMHTK